MGIRISIGAIIAVLLGGTGYFAQQLNSTKDLLQKRELELSKEKEASTKLKREVVRLEAMERRPMSPPPQPATAKDAAGSRVQEMSQLIAEEKAKNKSLEAALEQSRTELADARKKLGEASARNPKLASERAEETQRLEKDKALLNAQVQEMSQLIAEKTSAADLIRNRLDQTNSSLAEAVRKHTLAIARSKTLEEKARAETERAAKLQGDLMKMNAELKERSITLRRANNLLRVNIVNSLLFDSGNAAIKSEGAGALSKIADFLKKEKDKLIQIEGHTDDRPIQGSLARRYPTNWELSAARALAVVKFLESKSISPKRLSAVAYSYHRPAADNNSEEERAKNRRIVILMRSPLPNAAR